MRSFHHSSHWKKGLKVAFFGSDAFSIPALQALSKLSRTSPELIDSIDVIAKHQKPTGRGLKTTTDLPVVQTAKEEGLNVLRAEAKSEILDLLPNKYSLAIAVSYGKLIPKLFIEEVPYSLNIHPSLLPKYSGASPLQYSLLNEDEYTGVTIQTLHPTEFDKGQIVDQSDRIQILPREKLASLTDRLAKVGADMLVKTLSNGSYKNPNFVSDYNYSYAEKITPAMKEIDWNATTSSITARYNALGPLHSYKEIKVKQRRKPLVHAFRRVIFYDIEHSDAIEGLKPGEFILENDSMKIQTSDGSIVPKSLQFEFQKREDARTFIESLPKRAGDTTNIFTKRKQSTDN